MNKFNDTRIHQIELLLTLDYLLNYTDEDHPATQLDICRHARKYGLTFVENATSGNDVRRQRIADCLKFLLDVTTKFSEDFPFVLEKTNGNKYYIDQKNYLTEDQVIKILAAVKNDKYTKNEDTDFLIERLLDNLSSKFNREHYKEELEKLNKGVRKYNPNASRKIRLVNKALKDGKLLKIRWDIYENPGEEVKSLDFWYRVYEIKEFKGKPHALLLPISTGDIQFFQGTLFDPIENLNIPEGRDRDVLIDDFLPDRDLNKLFKACSGRDFARYGSIDEMVKANILPEGGIAAMISFHFRTAVMRFVQESFEEFFSMLLPVTLCKEFEIIPENDKRMMAKKPHNQPGYLIPKPLKEDEEPMYGVVNFVTNVHAFYSWLLSDVHGDGLVNIADLVVVDAPESINRYIGRYYVKHLLKYKKHLGDDKYIQSVIDRILEDK